MELLEMVPSVKRYHDTPLQEYGTLSRQEMVWVDLISETYKLPENEWARPQKP